MKTITVNYSNNCEIWWNAARLEAKGSPPPACVGLLDDVFALVASDEDTAEFLAWAESIPGYSERPFMVNE